MALPYDAIDQISIVLTLRATRHGSTVTIAPGAVVTIAAGATNSAITITSPAAQAIADAKPR